MASLRGCACSGRASAGRAAAGSRSIARVAAPSRASSPAFLGAPSTPAAAAAPARRLRASSSNGATATAADSATANGVPTPVVKIDNISDPFATLVSVEFGDRLGELLDTIRALKNLGLNIRRATLDQKSGAQARNTFYITDADTSEKVLKSARLEEIRMTIINNLLYYHPESAEALSAGKAPPAPARDATSPLGARARSVVPTTIEVRESANGSCSTLFVTTRDRPGLLVDVVQVLKDINVNVVSAEIDTVGDQAQDEFFVTYHGEPLSGPMTQLVTNALQYYLSLSEVAKEESY